MIRNKKPWVSFNIKEIDHIISLILDYGEASRNKDETLAGEAFEELDAILKYRKKTLIIG